MSLDGESLALPLGGEGVPVEPPGPIPKPGKPHPWLALGAFAIFGATTILVISGLGDLHGVEAGAMWRDQPDSNLELVDGPATSAVVYAVQVDDLPAIGRRDAKVTLVVVTDYACPVCERTRPLIQALRGRLR